MINCVTSCVGNKNTTLSYDDSSSDISLEEGKEFQYEELHCMQCWKAFCLSNFVIKDILFLSVKKLVGIRTVVLYVLVQLALLRVERRALGIAATFWEFLLIFNLQII
jgi:hypothetical protein